MPRAGDRGMTARGLEEALDRGRIAPIYILEGGARNEGTDRIALARCLERIRAKVLPEGEQTWNLTLLSGERIALSEILDCALTLPLLGGQRLVIVRASGEIVCAKDEAAQKEQIELLRRLGGEPGERGRLPSAVVVFVEPPLDGRLRVHKALVENATVVSCPPPGPHQMPRWIADEARTRNLTLAPGSAETLAAITGSNTSRAQQEIEKLSLYVSPAGGTGRSRAVTSEDVAVLAGGGAIADTWKMCDAVARLDEAQALTLARRLTTAGEEPIQLVGALAFRVRQMLKAAEAVAAGAPPGAIRGERGLWGSALEAIEGNVRRYDASGLLAGLEILYQADRSIKRGGDPEETLLSTLSAIVRSARSRAGRASNRI